MNTKIYTLTLILALLTSVSTFAQQYSVPTNAVYIELLGRTGDRFSVNYERAIYRVHDDLTFMGRVGTFYMQQNHFSEWDLKRKTGDVILGISTIYNAYGRHRLETGLGINIKWNNTEDFGFSTQELLTASIGYRLLPKNGKGLMFRANAELTKNADYNWLEYYVEGDVHQDKVMPWAAIAVGYAF